MKIDLKTRVDLELIDARGRSEALSFDLVEDSRADYYDNFLGISTPLARAILGQVAGARIAYQAGDIVEVRILAVSRSIRQAEDRTTERQETFRRAAAESDLKDRIAVATSVDNKWGDYDPAGLLDLLEQDVSGQPELPGNEEVEE